MYLNKKLLFILDFFLTLSFPLNQKRKYYPLLLRVRIRLRVRLRVRVRVRIRVRVRV